MSHRNDSDNEKDQIRRLRAGDRALFEEVVVQAHYESVWRQHLLLTDNRDIAADLTQETFVEAWRSIRTFRGEASLRTWLYTIAARVWQRSLTAQRAERNRQIAHPEILEDLPAVTPSPDKIVPQALFHEAVLCALRRLPDAQRLVLILCYRQDLSHTEAAHALGIPVGTVKSRLHEGLRHLRRLLAFHAEEE